MNYPDWPLSAPVNLTWEITHKCNLHCIHCLSGSADELPDELDFEECKSVVDQIAALKVFEINFGGGEPLLKSYFPALLEYIHARGIVTCISTNGTLLDRDMASFFSTSPLVQIQVSLDGATPEVNDRIRGKGTYSRIIQGIELLAEQKVSFSINTVVTSQNYHQLTDLKSLAGSYGANLRVSRFRPSGRARSSWEMLKLNVSQLEELANWLAEHPGILTGDSFFSISEKGRRELGLDVCGACKMTCCIDPVGAVYPCAFMQAEEFYAGSLRKDSFKAIWDNSPVFLRFRKLEPASCKKCPRFSSCRGGCPAVAYFVKNDLNSPDPECLASWSKGVSIQPEDQN
ncbi:MAG: mycofactocin radical SAM maturase [Dehalococcoidales bacterium]|nr:mycofactocin radical SAM maturase [Dehalococcoidales bacterium]